MSKVQQKISGCLRSFKGAQIYFTTRSYILTCQRHGVGAFEALDMLFKGNLPSYIDLSEIEPIDVQMTPITFESIVDEEPLDDAWDASLQFVAN